MSEIATGLIGTPQRDKASPAAIASVRDSPLIGESRSCCDAGEIPHRCSAEKSPDAIYGPEPFDPFNADHLRACGWNVSSPPAGQKVRNLLLPFDDPKEQARLARVERLLSGQLRHKLKRASELQFDYETATALATTNQ